MTSETETLKTNEFLRRRKLRLQQVREQSKDIAKKIRQRANVERLRQVVDLDARKQKEYFDRQEKLVQRLEYLYSKGLNNVGASHQSASVVNIQDDISKTDLSKLRGKEAAAELRKKRQEKLDEQKKLLDRRLQAREAANELSREKSSTVKVLSKPASTTEGAGDIAKDIPSTTEVTKECSGARTEVDTVTKNDMATQWDVETVPNEWEPNIPVLDLPNDDQDKANEQTGSKSEGTKRLDLFAISKEMPSDLRGRHIEISEPRSTLRPSLTLVSEYLQSRKLQLRSAEIPIKKKSYDDITNLKQTIQRTRASRFEGREATGKDTTRTDHSQPDHVPNRKNSVVIYNHNTRNIRDMPCTDEPLVVRDQKSSEDAYSQAMRQSEPVHMKDKQQQKKVEDTRTKVAVTKQVVEKEYKDTIKFLNALPKDVNKVNKTAYMDERRQQMQKEKRQLRMQQEYRKIEKECRRHHTCMNKSATKLKSPIKQNDDQFEREDFQYSWMPVPEGDGNLAVHTIPNTVKEGKSNNTVKFSKVDSYHEYRSRHKHTPPTKDTAPDRQSNKRCVKTVIIDRNTSQSSDESSTVSNASSVENFALKKDVKQKADPNVETNSSDAERIIIYKILDTKSSKHTKQNNKLLSDIAKSLTSIEKIKKSVDEEGPSAPATHHMKAKQNTKAVSNSVSFEQINEGIYKVADEGDNMATMQFNENPDTGEMVNVSGQRRNKICHCKRHLTRDEQIKDKGPLPQWEDSYANENTPAKRPPKICKCRASKENSITSPASPTKTSLPPPKMSPPPPKQPSTTRSASSFMTAQTERTGNALTDAGYIKLVDEKGHEAGKFYLDPTGLLKDNNYEVVIQLRKKDTSKEDNAASKLKIQEEKSDEVNLESEDSAVKRPEPEIQELYQSKNLPEKESNAATPRTPITQITTEVVTATDKTKEKSPSNTVEVTHADIQAVQSTKEKDISAKDTNTEEDGSPTSRLDMPSRPATTTYTQTTNSPIHRPIYFHMSSSTSTAYMSPPEIVMPTFLRHEYVMTEDEVCELEDLEALHSRVKYYNTNKKCKHARKSLSEINLHKLNKNKNITPPNTARSTLTKDSHDSSNFKRPSTGKGCKTSKKGSTKCKCFGCGVHNPPKHEVKKPSTKKRIASPDYNRTALNLNLNINRKHNDKFTSTSSSTNYKSKINSIVRHYINKLLALNREGLKAIEVAEQECSSVATPGSSIINVPLNINDRKPSIGNKISLEQIKEALLEQIVKQNFCRNLFHNQYPRYVYPIFNKQTNVLLRKPRKKPVHKVKSLNISKHLLKQHNNGSKRNKQTSLSTTTDDNGKKLVNSRGNKYRLRSSPLKQATCTKQATCAKSSSIPKMRSPRKVPKKDKNNEHIRRRSNSPKKSNIQTKLDHPRMPSPKNILGNTSPDSELTKDSDTYFKDKLSMSTQTNQNIDGDFVKLAEDKLLNMEKIADLTEKCTKRLSNLAKVLEEVRKNKTLVYNQISASDSSDSKSDQRTDNGIETSAPIDSIEITTRLELKSPEPVQKKETIITTNKENEPPEFIPFLADIPKSSEIYQLIQPNGAKSVPIDKGTNVLQHQDTSAVNTDSNASEIMKCRPKPPPALSRIHLKHAQEHIVPHELSTVLEVDSPSSVKNKNHSSRTEGAGNLNKSPHDDKKAAKDYDKNKTPKVVESIDNPDILVSNLDVPKIKVSSTEVSDDSKFQMIDLKQFNEIMLEPFISIDEYAKKYKVKVPDEGSNIEDQQRDDAINDDISSLHSDGSLPDVIAELLKRNIITEPFKFDTPSNVNSNTLSSESTLSMLALSKARKAKRRSNVMFKNKENIGETSDTLSISSNPDLENAFKKLGMGWASSTLKKTKERLALSSSSNTSSSSLQQFRMKSFNQDIPALVTDSVSSVLLSKTKGLLSKNDDGTSKHVEQQTSISNSMIVKEFLTNELANKITFTSNKSDINDTENEFVSLFETKMPETMKQQTPVNRDEQSNDSMPSGANRARTSTPVQLFKSMTYHSTSSSNISNGLFSNIDDLSSVKMTSTSMKNHSTSDKDDLTIPNFSLKLKKGSDCSKSD